jgi:tetratricopeptide (TPR) repeat protein
MSAGKTAEAEKHFRAALAGRPDLPKVHAALGEMYLEQANYAAAEKEFRAEAALTPASAEVAYKLGLSLANLGQGEAAAAELERSLRLRPEMPQTALELGKALAGLGRANDAVQAFEKVVTWEPASRLAEAAYLQLAQLYRKLGRVREAAAAAEKLRLLRQPGASTGGAPR